MARIGTRKNPAILRVQTEERATEIMALCDSYGIEFVLGIEPGESEDISDVERALHPPQPAVASARVGRNEPCPCGSGKKSKRCCGGTQPPT